MKNYLRYIYAILAVPLAILLRFAMMPLIGPGAPYITLFIVTVSVAILAGLGPAIVTGALGAVATDYFFIGKPYAIEPGITFFSQMAVVVLTSVFVGYIGDTLRAAREKAEKQALALRESQEDLNRAQAVANTGSWRLNVQKNQLQWSDEVYLIFGISRGTPLTYESFLAAVHPDDRDFVDKSWKAGLAGEHYDIEHRIVAAGQVKWVRERAEMEFDKQGALLGGFGTVQDITESKHAETELRKTRDELELRVQERTAQLSHTVQTLEEEIALRTAAEKGVKTERQRLYDVLDTLPVYVVLLTPDYHVPFANKFFRGRFGQSGGRRCFEYLFNRTEPCEICETYSVLKTMKPHEWEWTGPDGRNYYIFDFPFTDADGSTLILGVGIDITERKLAEQALKERSEQLRQLGGELTRAEQREKQRIARVLHDHLQQLLVGVKFHLKTSAGNLKRPAGKLDELIDESILVCRSLTSELSPPVLHEGSLLPAVEWLVNWMAENHGLLVEIETKDEMPILKEDVCVLLFESVRELLFNVVKHSKVNKAAVSFQRNEKDCIEVVVSDEGVGFDVDNKKIRPEGFGLFRIAERLAPLGGRIEIESRPGCGSRFILQVPMEAAVETATESGTDQGPASERIARRKTGGKGKKKIRVLIADDHALVRQGLSAMLENQDDVAVVGQAEDGRQAVDLARRMSPDLVIMDISMPIMDGIEATRQIVAEMPDVEVIGLSMYGDTKRTAAMRQAGAVAFMSKGVAAEEFLGVIRTCAASRSQKAAKKRID